MDKNPYRLTFLIFLWVAIQLVFFSFDVFAESTSLNLTSPAFMHNGYIPQLYTAEGKDISPPLVWKNIPKGTRSLAFICDDPDASGGDWVHWVLYNIPPILDHLEEGGKNLPSDVHIGKNSWGNLAYGGPQPPHGTHHYRFTLYALDRVLELKEDATKEQLIQAMKGHVLGEGTLIGVYHLQKVRR